MARANKLTQMQVARLKEPGYHGDGAGLWLKVTAQGSKSWILRYTFQGREKWTGLGSYPPEFDTLIPFFAPDGIPGSCKSITYMH